ncbi:MAG: molybdate ABC transporter substrate-binding protein [Kiloniellales bacterium]|nr:molybdate ABC transporter substrate-binding protein [Kiloniellales bacterium]
MQAGGLATALGLALGFLGGPAWADEVTIFAAASTTSAVEDLAARHTAARGDRVRTVFAASSTLAKQIAQGAPADLFLSANPAWMDYLAARGAVDPRSRVDLLGNRLVLIVPRDGAAASDDLDELGAARLAEVLTAGRQSGKPFAMADPAHVPAGLYGKAALEALGLWQSLDGEAVRTADVRAALALVDRGEVAAAVVYATDAALSPRVRIAGRFPAGSHPPILYPLAAMAGRGSAAAARFYDYLLSAEAAAVFRAHGFLVPPETPEPAP